MGLWQVLETGGGAQNVANVRKLVEYAAGKLILVRDTFPNYTLHDRQHAEDILKIMDDLLRDGIDKVTPLEAAMLVLAAYFHDIGMVYHPDEIIELVAEEGFRDYLDANPAAYVQVRQTADGIPQDVILDYCRARHADRVGEHLHQVPPGLLTWDGVPIAEALATLCRSHNEPRAHLRSESFPTAFLGACDLRMCAILLRLADILDFDQTRTPVAVYDHLGLASASEGARAVSNTEWSKHLASSGFRFPVERPPSYSIMALASPRRPAVEHAMRKFLDVVEDELRGCRILLDFCDQRWRSLALPGGIDRQGVISDGYHYGEYQFSLDRHAVLHLFMGDKLYANPYVFIRELLQNAIDACRLSCYLHDADPATMEVRVSAWEDDAGYFWLRVDDTGTGMDQDIVEKYFLGVGRSYYRSKELQADVLRKNKPRQNFVPISRFGIGILSSFIVGDRIEVSTRRRRPDGKLAEPLRLSLDGLEDFFTLREYPKHKATPIPGRHGHEGGYRKRAGTSVAIRIDPSKSEVSVANLLERARGYLHFPPIPIFINDIEQKDQALTRLDTPLLDRPIRHQLTQSDSRPDSWPDLWPDSRSGRHPLDLSATTNLSLVTIPLNLTASSPSPDIRGQLIAIGVDVARPTSLVPALPVHLRQQLPNDIVRALDECIEGYEVDLSLGDPDVVRVRFELICSASALLKVVAQSQFNLFGITMGNRESTVTTLRMKYEISLSSLVGDRCVDILTRHWLGHNGITAPVILDRGNAFTNFLDPEDPFTANVSKLKLLPECNLNLLMLGSVCLFDDLRPEVSASRDILRDVPYRIKSALHLAVRRAVAAYADTPERFLAKKVEMQSLLGPRLGEVATNADIECDPLAPEWESERIIAVQNGGRYGTEEVRRLAKHRPVKLAISTWRDRLYQPYQDFYSALHVGMAQVGLDLEISNTRMSPFVSCDVTVRSANRPVRPSGLGALPPFTVVHYDSASVLIRPGFPANLRHPIVSWFAEHATTLSTAYPAFFEQFMRAFRIAVKGHWEYDPNPCC